MPHVAGADGTPGGWAVVIMEGVQRQIRKAAALPEILDVADLEVIAVDIPIGLSEAYTIGRAPVIERRGSFWAIARAVSSRRRFVPSVGHPHGRMHAIVRGPARRAGGDQ